MMKRRTVLLVAVTVLVMAMLACGSSSGGTYSFSTTGNSSGNKGHIEVTGDANGSVSNQAGVDEDFPGATVDIEVTAGVLEGSYKIDFLDGSDVVFSLDVKPGELAKGSGTVTLNDEGEIEYELDASDAKGIKIVIDYERR
jgi:hypothetical protein